jgi:hypothetical protein
MMPKFWVSPAAISRGYDTVRRGIAVSLVDWKRHDMKLMGLHKAFSAHLSRH